VKSGSMRGCVCHMAQLYAIARSHRRSELAGVAAPLPEGLPSIGRTTLWSISSKSGAQRLSTRLLYDDDHVISRVQVWRRVSVHASDVMKTHDQIFCIVIFGDFRCLNKASAQRCQKPPRVTRDHRLGRSVVGGRSGV